MDDVLNEGQLLPSPRRLPGKFAFLFGDQALTDTKLFIRRSGSEVAIDQDEGGQLLHSTVLCANSSYFCSKLLGPAAPPSPGPRSIEIEVDSLEDVAPLMSVLRFMYTEDLNYRYGIDSPSELVALMRIAHRFQVPDCVAACRSEFSKLRTSDLDLQLLRMIYSNSTADSAMESCFDGGIMVAVESRLLELFGDGVAVLRNPNQLEEFLSLPLVAVCTLLNSDQLVVDSENTVAVLASVWVAQQSKKAALPLEHVKKVAGCIRLSLLSPSYLCGVLPNMKWYSFPAQSPAAYFHAVQSKLSSIEGRSLIQGQALRYQPVHARSAVKEQNLELMLEVEEARLEQYLKEGQLLLGFSSVNAGSREGGMQKEGSSLPVVAPRGVQVNSECSFFCGYSFGIKLVFGYSAASSNSTRECGMASIRDSSVAGSPAGNKQDGANQPVDTKQLRASSLPKTASLARSTVATATNSGTQSPPGLPSATAAPTALIRTLTSRQMEAADAFFSSGAPGLSFGVTPSVFASYPPGESVLLPLSCPISVSFRCTLEAVGPYGTPFAAATFTGGSFMRPGEESVSSIAVSNFFKKVGPDQSDMGAWQPFLCDGKLRLRLTIKGPSVE
ncbi:hypothetical protein CEUSTIGMA_g9543.t1 [Chlamydomonas eustigma]|uniref:BTB domain-containing protein n=1 Tax=Chlamydomonas eustigma TaxID=1157962 RepID=A0A250XGB0_9CHLO|nr:hypothetical protein CEUSTIGMA_g9543.t1 [Chlamydomonas eustigma]|eukprot:GAX82115.1 hypothetical protein CEUSTIGMA_g9543.t1 [Chlamydomonas eustigma]